MKKEDKQIRLLSRHTTETLNLSLEWKCFLSLSLLQKRKTPAASTAEDTHLLFCLQVPSAPKSCLKIIF